MVRTVCSLLICAFLVTIPVGCGDGAVDQNDAKMEGTPPAGGGSKKFAPPKG